MKLKLFLVANHLTAKWLAETINVSSATIRRLTSGRAEPSYKTVKAICAALSEATGTKVDPSDLF